MDCLSRAAALPLPQQDPLNDTFEAQVLTHDRARWARTQALLAAHPDLRLGQGAGVFDPRQSTPQDVIAAITGGNAVSPGGERQ